MSIGFVCLMGMGTVFIGLVCIILLCKIFSAVVRLGEKSDSTVKNEASAGETKVSNSSPANAEIQDKQKIIAAVCAVVAEELGTDISALRVLSFKKL